MNIMAEVRDALLDKPGMTKEDILDTLVDAGILKKTFLARLRLNYWIWLRYHYIDDNEGIGIFIYSFEVWEERPVSKYKFKLIMWQRRKM